MYTSHLLKLTWGGSIAGQDEWTNQIHLLAGDGSLEDTVAAFNDTSLALNMAGDIADAYGGTGGLARYENLSWIKLSVIDQEGLLVGEPKWYDYTTPVIGTSTFNVPPQDSIVVTLTTAESRGLAYKGRIFLPAGFGDVQGADGRLTPAQTSSIATRFKTFFDAVNDGFSVVVNAPYVVVASNVRTGATNRVTGVQVGNLVDTQRRRRNRLNEAYSSADLI